MRRIIGRKGQEEIVGFVVIVVIVTIVLLVFLGIFMRKTPIKQEGSLEIYQFLESVMEYTSDCALSYEPDYSKIGELIDKCHLGVGICTNGMSPCEVLNGTLKSIIDSGFFVSEDASKKGYEYSSFYSYNGSVSSEMIVSIKEGNCSSGVIRGSEILSSAYPGTIVSSLEICY